MALSSRQCKVEKIVGPLARWRREADAKDKRTVLLRTIDSLHPETAREELGDHGVDVITAGVGTLVIGVTPASLTEIEALDWILSIEEPHELHRIAV